MALCFGFGALAFKSRRFPTPCRRRQRSSPARRVFGFRNSRTTASRSSSDTSSVVRNGLLGQGQRRLQPVRRMTSILIAGAVTPLILSLLGRAEAFRQSRCRLIACLERRPYLWCRRCLFVKMDQHGRTPCRISLRTDLAMKNADRRGSM